LFLAYLDSSGRPLFEDKESYVLASVITNERSWQAIDNGVKQIKIKHFPNLPDNEVELHAKDMLNHDGIFKSLSWDEIYAIFSDVFDFISNPDSQLTLIAVVIQKDKLNKNTDTERWAFGLIFERLNKFIARQNAQLMSAGYPQEYGIMIMDSEGEKKDSRLRNKITGMLRHGTEFANLTSLIEDPLFTDSKWRNMSQLADNVAYCVRKNLRSNTMSFHTANWTGYFKKIEPRFDCRSSGSYLGWGLKIFP
jgi:hypothetical protein